MKEKQKTKEKACVFYVSDYHFEMISLPYINENLEKNKEIIILTENNLEQTINKVISRMNLKEDRKTNILNNIDWREDNQNKIKKIEEISEKQKEAIIFIKGDERYIKKINDNIEKWIIKNKKIKLIDCYDIEGTAENVNSIMSKYKSVLTTAGERKINK